MQRLRIAILIVLGAGPFVFLFGMGWYALWERGWAFWAWWPLTGMMALAYVLALYWSRRNRLMQPFDFTRPELGTERDRDAWKLVEARAIAAGQRNPDDLTNPHVYLDTAQEMAQELARFYHPRATDPVGSLTVPEILAVVELAAHDLAELVDRYVPGGHLLSIDHLRNARKAADLYQSASNLYWLIAAALSPVETGAKYLASRMGITKPWQLIQQNLLVWFYTAFIHRLGNYLIEMYSGRLRVGATRYRELVHAAPRDGQDERPAAQVTVTLIGQTNAGKSSLINALLGEERAKTDVVPATEAVTRYELHLEDVPSRLVLFDTEGYGEEGPKERGLKATLEAARGSDLLILVLHARNPARQADVTVLETIQRWFAERPELKMPLILAVLTHIDLLSPVMEWAPPYDWQSPERLKEQQIAGAVAAVQESMGKHLAFVAPACTAEGKVYGIEEWVLPALVSLLDEARGVALVRVLKAEARAGQVGKVFRQLVDVGSQAVKALWAKPRG